MVVRLGNTEHAANPLRPTQRGVIEIVCGCMFAGKTETLLDRVCTFAPEHVQVFKHAVDIRYHPSRVVSHRRRSHAAVAVTDTADIHARIEADTKFVAIDEGHFFGPGFIELCNELADRGVSLLITALDPDSWARPIPAVEALKIAADVVTLKSATCAQCDQQATCTQRLIPFEDTLVGGSDAFEPRCVQCWTPPPESGQTIRPASNTGPCVQQSS